MRIYYEWGIRQVHKEGEELCGDSVAVSRHTDSVTLALSDGLGSGVKANILATLTTRIAMSLLENDLPLGEVVQTLSETLPVDAVRKMAYSTFAIAQFYTQGSARVVEFDSPPAIFLHSRKTQPLAFEEKIVGEKAIREYALGLKPGDWAVFVSDGVINAGIGGVYPLGWGWEQLARYTESQAHQSLSAEDLADKIADTVEELYAGPPGDDVSIVVIKCRRKLFSTVLTGPPMDRGKDEELAASFVSTPGKLAICGGTTAKIVARHIGQPLEVELETMTPEVPPKAHLEGVDLVSEGILTLTKVSELLRAGAERKAVRFQNDGASCLLRLLLDMDHIHFIVGKAVNPAHQNPDLPHSLGIRMSVVREIAEELRERGKEVDIEEI